MINSINSRGSRAKNYLWVYVGIIVLVSSVILYFLFFSHNFGYVTVKYRDDKVNISASNFEPLNKSDSTVKGAWYDSGNKYMIIKLGSTYYQYCGMPSGAWRDFLSANSPYQAYQSDIRGNFDCRENPVPSY